MDACSSCSGGKGAEDCQEVRLSGGQTVLPVHLGLVLMILVTVQIFNCKRNSKD